MGFCQPRGDLVQEPVETIGHVGGVASERRPSVPVELAAGTALAVDVYVIKSDRHGRDARMFVEVLAAVFGHDLDQLRIAPARRPRPPPLLGAANQGELAEWVHDPPLALDQGIELLALLDSGRPPESGKPGVERVRRHIGGQRRRIHAIATRPPPPLRGAVFRVRERLPIAGREHRRDDLIGDVVKDFAALPARNVFAHRTRDEPPHAQVFLYERVDAVRRRDRVPPGDHDRAAAPADAKRLRARVLGRQVGFGHAFRVGPDEDVQRARRALFRDACVDPRGLFQIVSQVLRRVGYCLVRLLRNDDRCRLSRDARQTQEQPSDDCEPQS